jgi:hypothetical protein
VNSTIVAVSERREGLPIPLAGVVLVIPEVVLFDIADERVKVSWYAPYEKEKIRNAMAGGPMLVVEGKVMIDKDEEDFSKTAPPVTFSQVRSEASSRVGGGGGGGGCSDESRRGDRGISPRLPEVLPASATEGRGSASTTRCRF